MSSSRLNLRSTSQRCSEPRIPAPVTAAPRRRCGFSRSYRGQALRQAQVTERGFAAAQTAWHGKALFLHHEHTPGSWRSKHFECMSSHSKPRWLSKQDSTVRGHRRCEREGKREGKGKASTLPPPASDASTCCFRVGDACKWTAEGLSGKWHPRPGRVRLAERLGGCRVDLIDASRTAEDAYTGIKESVRAGLL